MSDTFQNLIGTEVKIYSSREEIRSMLSDFAKEYLDLREVDLYKTSFLSYTIDILSILASNQLFYSSMIYKEFFFVEAQLKESVYNLSRWIGYTPDKAVASKVDAMFTLPLNFSISNISFGFPNTFKLKAGDIPFMIDSHPSFQFGARVEMKDSTSTNNLAIGKIINNNAITVRTADGQYRPVYVSSSGKFFSFMLPFTQQELKVEQFVVPSNLEFYQFYSKEFSYSGMLTDIKIFVKEPKSNETLRINDDQVYTIDPDTGLYDYDSTNGNGGQEWLETPNGLYTMSSTANEFALFSTNDKCSIMFGNGVIGRQPKPGSKVLVLMYISRGEQGKIIPNSLKTGDRLYYLSYTNVDGTLQQNATTYTIQYTVTNPSPSVGGKDVPSLPEIKNNAIINLRSKKRLVSEQDYDDVNEIMGADFPVSESYPILKRSDIKVNEIMMFNRLVYHDEFDRPEIVPTRNIKLSVISPTFSGSKFTIPRRTVIDIDGVNYETLFNVTADSQKLIAEYDYIMNFLNSHPVFKDVTESYYRNEFTSYAYIPAKNCNFSIDMPKVHIDDLNDAYLNGVDEDDIGQYGKYPLRIELNVNHVPSIEITEYRCKLITKWDENSEYMMLTDKTSEAIDAGNGILLDRYNFFHYTFSDYRVIPQGKQRYEFMIEGKVSDASIEGYHWEPIQRYYSDSIIRLDLSDSMMSTVTSNRTLQGECIDGTCWNIHNVPVILSSYLDDDNGNGVYNRDNQQNFETVVLQRLLSSMDMSSKRMMTDFINIKFPDTWGKLKNLRFNPYQYSIVSRTNTPFSNPMYDTDYLENGDRFIVNGPVPGYESNPLEEYINFISTYNKLTDTWSLIEPYRNMYVRVIDEINDFEESKVYVFNSSNWINSETFDIPLRIRVRVTIKRNAVTDPDTVTTEVKRNLITYFMKNFGINRSIDRSEIISVVRSTKDVEFCDLIDPSIDIRFKYNIKDLTKKQLLDYTPQYVGFVNDSIDVEVVES